MQRDLVEQAMADEISGGETGVRVWVSGSPSFTGNSITGVSNTGFFIAAGTSPVLSGNVVCDNARNLVVAPGADPVIDDDNRICDQDPATE